MALLLMTTTSGHAGGHVLGTAVFPQHTVSTKVFWFIIWVLQFIAAKGLIILYIYLAVAKLASLN